MERILAFGLIVALGTTLHAQTIKVRGKVSNAAGQPVANAVVELVHLGLKDTTGSDGTYFLTRAGVANRISFPLAERMRLDDGILEFTVESPSPLKIEAFDGNGNLRSRESVPMA